MTGRFATSRSASPADRTAIGRTDVTAVFKDGEFRSYEPKSSRTVTLSESTDGLFIAQGEFRVGLTKELLKELTPLIAFYNEFGQLPVPWTPVFLVDDPVCVADLRGQVFRIAKVTHGPEGGSAFLVTMDGRTHGWEDFRRLRKHPPFVDYP